MAFRVLFVCTANICRSAMAESLFTARLPADSGIEVLSAGMRALVGEPMDDDSATVLRELGGDPSAHTATQITDALISDSDLVLTATSAHRAEILREQPAAMRRAFTLGEFARLGASTDAVGTPAERVAAVAAERGVAGPGGADDELADPYGAPLEEVRACGQRISAAVDIVVRVLTA